MSVMDLPIRAITTSARLNTSLGALYELDSAFSEATQLGPLPALRPSALQGPLPSKHKVGPLQAVGRLQSSLTWRCCHGPFFGPLSKTLSAGCARRFNRCEPNSAVFPLRSGFHCASMPAAQVSLFEDESMKLLHQVLCSTQALSSDPGDLFTGRQTI